MTNPFKDQKEFMQAAGQSTGEYIDMDQAALYMGLVMEEVQELFDTESVEDTLKEAADVIVVLIGMMCSFGVDPEEVWREVHRSNMSKLTDGKLVKREDGKVLKPDTYVPANLVPIVDRILEPEEFKSGGH